MESKASRVLAAYLRSRKLSHAEFAEMVEANRSQIYRLAKGQRGPSVGLAARIERATAGRIRSADWLKPPRAGKQASKRVVRESSVPHVEQRST